jgi:hypothetical protein
LGEKADTLKKQSKKFKIITGVGVCLAVVGVVLFLGITALIQSTIYNQINQQVQLSKDNEGAWSRYPGDSGTILTRNYSFFGIMNAEGFLLHGEKPKFKEVMDFKLQEFEEFFDIRYSDDDDKVTFKDWLYFHEYIDSRDIDEKVKVLNIPYLGYWFTLKKSRDPVILL